MQLKQLAYYIAVVEEGSFSRAAVRLYMAQSSLSQSIRLLEEELGFSLLIRNHGGAIPTEMGKKVYADAKKLLLQTDNMIDAWKKEYEAHASLTGTIRIATVPGAFFILKNKVVPQLEAAFPNLKIKLLEIRGNFLLSGLSENQADLILGDYLETEVGEIYSFAQKNGLELLPLREDEYKIGVGKKRALSKKKFLTKEETRKLPLAFYYGNDPAAEAYLKESFSRDNVIEYTSMEKMVREAECGPGVSVLPELTIRNTWPGLLNFLSVKDIRVPFTHYAGIRCENRSQRIITEALSVLQRVFKEELV